VYVIVCYGDVETSWIAASTWAIYRRRSSWKRGVVAVEKGVCICLTSESWLIIKVFERSYKLKQLLQKFLQITIRRVENSFCCLWHCFNINASLLLNILSLRFSEARSQKAYQRNILILLDLAVQVIMTNTRVGNLRHACRIWHAKQFPKARRISTFYISILLWFTRSIIIDLNLYKNTYVAGTLNDLEL